MYTSVMPAKKTAKIVKKVGNSKDPIENLVSELREKFGEGAIMTLGEARKVDVDVIPTGSFSLNVALGVGGLPRGRIVEVYGPESGGKSTLALTVVAAAQKMGRQAAYIDAEHALDPVYAQNLGVDINTLLISQPDSGEEALNILDTVVRSGAVSVVVVDSVAALTPKAEIEGEMGAQFIGLQARMMSQALRKLTAVAARSETLIIFINQIRMQVGIMFGNPETTPGGKALKFYSSVRIDVRRAAQIKKGDEVIGSRVKVKVVKNKVAPPFRVGEFDLMFDGTGISYEADVLNTAVKLGVVTKAGASYSMGAMKLGTGFDAVRTKMKENPELRQQIEEATLAEISQKSDVITESTTTGLETEE